MSETVLEFPMRDGLTLRAVAHGDPADAPVLLSHGGGQTRHSWHTTVAHLGANGWFAVALDLRGHGDSDWAADGDYSIEAFADDIVEVARRIGNPVLVGASLGGSSSLAALGRTADEPCGRALVLVDIAPSIETAGVRRIGKFMTEHAVSGFASLEEVAAAVHAYNPHRPRPSDLSGLRKNVRQREDGRWYWHWDPKFVVGKFGDDETRAVRSTMLEEAARSLSVPTLLVRGRHSDLLSEEGARSFLQMVPGARYADVGGAGHMVAGDRNDAFNDAVVGFLEDLRG